MNIRNKNQYPKTHFIGIRLTPKEFEQVNENAIKLNLSVSAYIRMLIAGAQINITINCPKEIK